MQKKISVISLIVLIIASIDNVRNLPAAALFGSSLFFFFFLSAIIFLIPTALVSAELSATFHTKGGVYQWVNKAFGEKWAMGAIWLQWINTMVWYPTMLSFVAGTLAYLIHPELAQNKGYIIAVVLSVFWGLTWVNLKGIHISALLNNIFATMGTIFPLIFLIILGGIWFFSDQPTQITFTSSKMIPNLGELENWVSLIAIMASFLGMELSGVHVNDIRDPQRNFPRAVLIASLFIFVSMLFGSLSIALVLPEQDISLISGMMQLFTRFFEAFHMQRLVPVLTILIAMGAMGTMINWLIAPAKGLLHAAEFGFLPTFFTRKNRAGVAYNILLAQAIVVTIFCLFLYLIPSINAFYWFLTALSTELYMIMYILMFSSAIRLHYSYKDRPSSFKIPGNNIGMCLVTLLGLLGCIATIIISFYAPESIDFGSQVRYLVMIALGNLITITPVFLFFLYKNLHAG